jgi:hypothetical protein
MTSVNIPGSGAYFQYVNPLDQEEETEPGKLVSITPDIVKPLKEVKNREEEEEAEQHERAANKPSTATDVVADVSPSASPSGVSGGGLLKSGSSGRLPDMLTHTPDGPQAAGSLTRGAAVAMATPAAEAVMQAAAESTGDTRDHLLLSEAGGSCQLE